jgi:hypothetical protein
LNAYKYIEPFELSRLVPAVYPRVKQAAQLAEGVTEAAFGGVALARASQYLGNELGFANP